MSSLGLKGKLANHFTNGVTLVEHKCQDCSQKVSTYAIRCKACNYKHISAYMRAYDLHPVNYKGGFKICSSCGATTRGYQAKLCASCASKLKARSNWKRKTYRDKVLRVLKINQPKATLKAIKSGKLFNKFEQTIARILPYDFKYVGNGTKWVGPYNPDFINEKHKLIIETFGDYWHNLPSAKIRDQRRLKTYINKGYRVLIVWERELKSRTTLVKKVKSFISSSTGILPRHRGLAHFKRPNLFIYLINSLLPNRLHKRL